MFRRNIAQSSGSLVCIKSSVAVCLQSVGRITQNEIWLYGSKGTLHLDLDAKKLSIALQEAGESNSCLPSWTLVCDVFMSHVYRRLQAVVYWPPQLTILIWNLSCNMVLN